MNEESSFIPSLTLDPGKTEAAAAVQEAPAAEEIKKDIPIERQLFIPYIGLVPIPVILLKVN